MLILGFNQLHDMTVDQNPDLDEGIEKAVVLVGIEFYPHWSDLLVYTDELFDRYLESYSPEGLIKDLFDCEKWSRQS